MPGAALDPSRRVFRVSQSWLQDFMRCPERARWELLHPSKGYNDATGLGVALHRYMEGRLNGLADGRARILALTWLHHISSNENFQYVKVAKQETMMRHLEACIEGFERHVVPQVPGGGAVEERLHMTLDKVDDWSLELEGTPDYVDPFGRVWDWKTASSDYNVWEAANWFIQPTAYTMLASETWDEEITQFTYAVGVKPHGAIQLIDVERRDKDWDWLARIARGALNLARHHLHDEWPVNHNHFLCSPDWCPHWPECRGAYETPTPVVVGTAPTPKGAA